MSDFLKTNLKIDDDDSLEWISNISGLKKNYHNIVS